MPIATKSKPSAIARSIVSRLVMPPSRISGIFNSARNSLASRSRYASRYGYSRRIFLPDIRTPHRIGGLKTLANSLSGTSPRNRYIGLTNELPAVSSMASSPPSSSSHLAVCSASSTVMPPRTPSVMLSFAVTAI